MELGTEEENVFLTATARSARLRETYDNEAEEIINRSSYFSAARVNGGQGSMFSWIRPSPGNCVVGGMPRSAALEEACWNYLSFVNKE